ncbi:MAG: hypothetical protein UY13_C0002G0340 [Candidatus Pacebacteria bacterium GW2011_GWB1_47_8]|nr:MAG: hypothetical protein UX28_C0001G0488 [Candidatus Pacebacteria bacterium GW2011_GWA1_46_10]KKU84428.1 MAG: hypothetical protein UY13_C0002G0340 [Candidatus Pacebacteria bacterium GW2011_GWB1_47_8]
MFAWVSSPTGRLLLLIVVAAMVRLYRITNPVADWHAFRQADTASVTREYIKRGVDWLRPRYQDLSNIQSGQDNLEGYRMVEFPLINGVLATLLRAIPSLPLVLTSRLATVLISLGSLWFLVDFVTKITGNKTVGWLSGLFFALLPYSVYYSRTILPEPYVIFFSLASLSCLVSALQFKRPVGQWQWWVSAVCLSVAFLLKPFVVFLAPVYAVIIWQQQSKIRYSPWWVVYGLLAVAPFLWWRYWIQQFSSGIPAADWLLNGNGIRFRPAWFRWIFYERFTKLIMGYTGIVIAATSLWYKGRGQVVLWAWWLGLITYTAVVATGNVQHDYYQVIFTPLISFTLALGTWLLWQKSIQLIYKAGVITLIAVLLVLSWQQVAGYFNVNHWEYVEAGRAVDQLTPLDAKVIAPAFGDTHFLFQTNRTGWPIGFEIDDKISQGATHYVTTSFDDEAQELESRFATVVKTDRYLILNLTQPKEKQ